MIDMDSYWPKSVAHLKLEYDNKASEYVVIGEIDDSPHHGNKGFKKVSTALIPIKELDRVLNQRGGIGWEVESWGPHPCVDDDSVYDTSFWICGNKRDEKFQTLLNAWKHHDQEVMLPDSIMLMTYGLVPRYLNDGTVCWDDPQKPVYDVIRARSHIDYNKKGDVRPLILITMRRDYLEDYSSLKKCAAVAVYYEERFSSGDTTFDELLGEKEGCEYPLPGRLLGMANLKDRYHKHNPQFSRVWGVRLILNPSSRPITNEIDPALLWPDYVEPMTFERAARDWIYGYVSDKVLSEYESRPEYSVSPESGGVSYGGWWATAYTSRISRDFIKIELKKLYEGCPLHVISHWHKFSVPEAVALENKKIFGERNIAIRAKELIYSFLRLTEALEVLADKLGTGFSQEDIGVFSVKNVDYVGWWNIAELISLGHVASAASTREQFLARAITIFKLFESLKPAPLRAMVLQLKLPKDKIKDLASLRLLATICQLAALAKDNGYDLPEDSDEVVRLWDANFQLPLLKKIFALNALRVTQAHAQSADSERKIADAAAVFGIDVMSTTSGWGFAIDALYDGLIQDLNSITETYIN